MKPKLGEKEHKLAKQMAKNGVSAFHIATHFKCSVDTIKRILSGKTKIRKPGEVARKAAEARWGKKKPPK